MQHTRPKLTKANVENVIRYRIEKLQAFWALMEHPFNLSINRAARVIGISRQTLFRWGCRAAAEGRPGLRFSPGGAARRTSGKTLPARNVSAKSEIGPPARFDVPPGVSSTPGTLKSPAQLNGSKRQRCCAGAALRQTAGGNGGLL